MDRRYAFVDVVIFSLLLIAPVIRLALLTGPTGSDDLNYFHFAQQLSRLEQFSQLHHHAGRLAFLVIVGVPAALIGSITSGCVLNVLILSIRDLLVVWFVRRQVGTPEAAIAAAIVSLNAISSTYVGIMVPDPLLSLLMFGSAVALYFAETGGPKRRMRRVAISGALAALGYSAKDTGILMIAPSLIFIALSMTLGSLIARARMVVVYVAGFGGVVACEMLAYLVISGDPFYRSHAISFVHNATIAESANLQAFLHAIYWNLRLVTTIHVASTQVLAVSAIVFVGALASRSRLAFFSVTGLFVGLYLIFGSSSFTRLMPLPVQDRYFEPLIPFFAVSAAALIARCRASGWSAMRMATAVVAAMVVGGIPAVTANAGDVAFSGVGRNAAVAIRAARAARPDLPIYVSPMLHRIIEPFLEPEAFAALRSFDTPVPEHGFHLAHPWEEDSSPTSRLMRVKLLPVYLVVDEDQRWLGRFSGEPKATNRGAFLHIQAD